MPVLPPRWWCCISGCPERGNYRLEIGAVAFITVCAKHTTIARRLSIGTLLSLPPNLSIPDDWLPIMKGTKHVGATKEKRYAQD